LGGFAEVNVTKLQVQSHTEGICEQNLFPYLSDTLGQTQIKCKPMHTEKRGASAEAERAN